MNILFITKVQKILVLVKWIHPIMWIIGSQMDVIL